MPVPTLLDEARLFLRLILAGILLSSSVGKAIHPIRFRSAIEDYRVFPNSIGSKFRFSTVLAVGIPLAESLAGLGLLSGFLLVQSILLGLILLIVFCVALSVNLMRHRYDLSCHCGGAMGDHKISWWQVGRNGVLMLCLLVLLVTRSDIFTLSSLASYAPALVEATWVNAVLPVVLLAGVVLLGPLLFNAARSIQRP